MVSLARPRDERLADDPNASDLSIAPLVALVGRSFDHGTAVTRS